MTFTSRHGRKRGIIQQRIIDAQKQRIKMKEELTKDEVYAAKNAGINLKQFWAVAYDSESTPLAIFDSKENAEKWKHEMCRTAIIEPYALQIK